jgi:hypothetical protein
VHPEAEDIAAIVCEHSEVSMFLGWLLLASCKPDAEIPHVVRDRPTLPGPCDDAEIPYDGLDNDCDPLTDDDDLDGDGLLHADDCDDQDPALGGPEIPFDGLDNDCYAYTFDEDGDGDGIIADWDCNDADPHIGGSEVVGDGLDNDCDGVVDCEAGQTGELAGDLYSWNIPGFCAVDCARSVTGDVDLTYNLSDVHELYCLTSVGGTLWVEDGDLYTLRGLDSLQSVGGDLYLRYNPALTDVTALYHLEYVGGDVHIEDNLQLSNDAAWALVDEIDTLVGGAFVSGN